MEEYLQYVKTLRSQINDVEDQAAKVTAEEQVLLTTIQTMENDLNFAKAETKQVREDTEKLVKEKGQICSQILEKQSKIASLEFDSSTLSQTLELIQQEGVSLSAKVQEKRAYYTKVADDINANLQQQQEWVNSDRIDREMGHNGMVKDKCYEQMAERKGKFAAEDQFITDHLGNDARKNLIAMLHAAEAKLDEIIQMKSKLLVENSKMKKSIEQLKFRAKDFQPELLAMDIKALEEEYKALLSDKSDEYGYCQSLQDQIEKLEGISHVIECTCGVKCKVAVDLAT